MIVPQLDPVAVGSPITRLGVSFFPVYLPANHLPAIVTGEASGLAVDELEAPSVQALRVRNPGDKPVLLVEGEHFLGGKQNRAVNATVLVPALGDLEIPVSCLEQGRWGRRRASRRDEAFAAARVRRAQNAGVAESMRRSGSRDGDQSAVWREVDQMLQHASVRSATAAASDVKQAAYQCEPSRAAAVEKLAERGPLPGQCGVVVVHGRRVAAMDLFGAPHLLAAHWGALVRSHLLDSPAATGRPSATRVLEIVQRFASAQAQTAPGVGLGVEHRVADERLTGQALTLGEAIVHAAFFAKDRGEEAGADGDRVDRRRTRKTAGHAASPVSRDLRGRPRRGNGTPVDEGGGGSAELPTPIVNCYWVDPGRLLAGEYPRNPDDASSRRKLQALTDAGVSAFIDLTEEGELTRVDALKPYAQWLPNGIHRRFPITDGSVPDSPELTTVILDAIDQDLAAGRTVYVHCWGGVGRTGLIVGCWLARHGRRGGSALERLRQLWRRNPKSLRRPSSPERPEQEEYVRRWPRADH